MMGDAEEIDVVDNEQIVARVAAIDVAKASGKVCARVPHPSDPARRLTRVWDVPANTNSIAALAEQLATEGIERIVVESTSDYWRPFVYLLQARGLDTWLVNARDVKGVPGRPKTDKLDAVWLALKQAFSVCRGVDSRFVAGRRGRCSIVVALIVL